MSIGWGIVGTGGIADEFCRSLASSSSGTERSPTREAAPRAIVGSSLAKAQAFARRWHVPKAFASLSELVADPGVDAVYIATPNVLHEQQTMVCIDAGKPVLCEKPLATHAAGASRVFNHALRRGVFVMEAFMYRFHPAVIAALTAIRNGAVGGVRKIYANFGYAAARDPFGRLFDPALGGGAILDVGGYPVSLARAVMGASGGVPFIEPRRVQGSSVIGPTGVDEWSTAWLTFDDGATAHVSCAICGNIGTQVCIEGTDGSITFDNPWIPMGQRQGVEMSLQIRTPAGAVRTQHYRAERPVYALEADYVAERLASGVTGPDALQPAWPAMSWADTVGNLRVLDAWRAARVR